MSPRNHDPFGFAKAINWDVVDQHADVIAAMFEKNESPNLGEDGETA